MLLYPVWFTGLMPSSRITLSSGTSKPSLLPTPRWISMLWASLQPGRMSHCGNSIIQVRMLSTIAACGTIKKEIGLRRDSEAFLYASLAILPKSSSWISMLVVLHLFPFIKENRRLKSAGCIARLRAGDVLGCTHILCFVKALCRAPAEGVFRRNILAREPRGCMRGQSPLYLCSGSGSRSHDLRIMNPTL